MPKKDKVKIERNVKKDDKKESSASKDKQKEGIYEFVFFSSKVDRNFSCSYRTLHYFAFCYDFYKCYLLF